MQCWLCWPGVFCNSLPSELFLKWYDSSRLLCRKCCSLSGTCDRVTGRCECDSQRFGPGCEFGQCKPETRLTLAGGVGPSKRFGMAKLPSSGDITAKALDSAYGDNLDCVWTLEVQFDLTRWTGG